MKVYSNLVFDVQNKIRCLPFPGQNITDNTIQLQVIYGRHSAVLSLFSYRVPPNYKRPIVKCDANNEDNNVSIVQRNIMKFSFCFASFFLSRSYGDHQSLFFFASLIAPSFSGFPVVSILFFLFLKFEYVLGPS